MSKEIKQLSLHQKWEMDIEAAKKGGTMLYLQRQCEYCKYNKKIRQKTVKSISEMNVNHHMLGNARKSVLNSSMPYC